MSTTHDWARDLQRTAEFLLSREAIEIGVIPETRGWFWSEKQPFIALVRATMPGRKETSNDYISFIPAGANLQFTINRSVVCRRLNPEYECEPLLSPEEDAEMEAKTEATT
jgi:hypothetical protein